MVKRQNPRGLPLTAIVIVTALALAGLVLFRLHHPAAGSDPARELEPGSKAAHASAATWPPEEIFRRAFWRQPAAQDRILHAERRESTPATAVPTATPPDIQRWQWFIAVQPGTELLRALRDPDSFGLVSTATPRPWSEPAPDPLPAWFPSAAPPAEFEILQAPAGYLTLLYRARDNTLFATDTGAGFAPAVQRSK